MLILNGFLFGFNTGLAVYFITKGMYSNAVFNIGLALTALVAIVLIRGLNK